MLEANLRTGALLTEEVFDPWVHLDAQLSLARYLALTRSSASLHLRLLRRAVAQMAPSAMTLRAFGKALDQGVFGDVFGNFFLVLSQVLASTCSQLCASAMGLLRMQLSFNCVSRLLVPLVGR